MISSSTSHGSEVSHGIEIGLRAFSGARGVRVIGGGNTIVAEHSHDWPVLSLYVMGDYRKIFGAGETSISGPSVVLHGAREAHSNRLNHSGLEQIDLQFDPRWLRRGSVERQIESVQCWVGGPVAAAGAQLASLWSSPAQSERQLADATARFLHFALNAGEPRQQPVWLGKVLKLLQIDAPPSASELAEQVGLHPTWLAQAYRAAIGEGLRQTLHRRRVEHATGLLRGSSLPLADIAASAGFCDQSHMNRQFRQLLGRTPVQVRAEGKLLKAVHAH